MLRYLFLVGVFTLTGSTVISACDACGCTISQIYWGMPGDNNQHYIGLWWQHQRYQSSFGGSELFSSDMDQEWFNTVEARLKYNLSSKVQVLAIIPYQYHLRPDYYTVNRINSLGDVSILANYLLWQSSDSLVGTKFQQQIQVGAGIKTPTGSFRLIDEENNVNPNFQAGSGSWDALFNLTYNGRLKDFGWNINAIYRFNSTNANDYRFGNRLNSTFTIFYSQRLGTVELVPSVGFFYEHADWDVLRNYYRTNTGGYAWFGTTGVECYVDNYNIGMHYMLPLQANWADGYLEPRARFAVHLNLFF